MGKPKTAENPGKAESTVKKSDRTTVSQRIEEVLRIRLDGAQFHDIVQYAAEKEWGVNDRQLRNYIQRADELLVERQDKSRKKVVARHLAQRQSLYARAVNAADYRTALAILDSEAKLRGLYPTANVADLLKLAVAQEERVRKLEAETNASPDGTTPPTDPETKPTPRQPRKAGVKP